jgi:hypothetical protein
MLLIAAVLALAADRYARGDSRAPSVRNAVSAQDLARFVTPFHYEPIASRSMVAVGVDPFGGAASFSELPVDSGDLDRPGASPRARTRLTAILVADNSRVAVIDDATVSVGDILRDGSRVSAIQHDRVWLVDRNGQWRMLSLISSRQ